MWHLSCSDVDILIAGFYKVVGYPDGSFLSVKKDATPFVTKRCLDGEIARTYRNDQSFTVEITLAQSSPSNDIFMKFYELDCITRNAKFPVFIKDHRGSTLFLSATSWINTVPDITYSNGIETRTWSIQCLGAIENIGGNDDTSLFDDIVNTITGALPQIAGII